jgi:hypothetical protein
MKLKLTRALFLLAAMASSVATAAELRTEHTYALSEGDSRPAATIEDASWLVGDWSGTAFGKQFEEVWSPASAGTMVGTFKLLDDNGVDFYELMLLEVQEGSLSLKVKHFSKDFTAWEDKEDFVNFRLVKIEPDALHFSGLSFYRRSADVIDGYIVMKSGDNISEQHLTYQRRAAGNP